LKIACFHLSKLWVCWNFVGNTDMFTCSKLWLFH